MSCVLFLAFCAPGSCANASGESKAQLMLAHISAEKMGTVGFGVANLNVQVMSQFDLMASGSYTQPIPKNHLASCETRRSHDTPVDADTSTDNFM